MPALDNGWMKIDTTSGSGSTAIAVVVSDRNMARTTQRSQSIVGTNAHGITAEATIVQNGYGNYVEPKNGSYEIAYDLLQLNPQFNTNCKYISLSLSGEDADKFTIAGVYCRDAEGQSVTLDTPESGVYEPEDDPGQTQVLLISVVVSSEQNDTDDDFIALLELTGWSEDDKSDTMVSNYTTLVHKKQPLT